MLNKITHNNLQEIKDALTHNSLEMHNTNAQGMTPLHCAIAHNNMLLITLLLQQYNNAASTKPNVEIDNIALEYAQRLAYSAYEPKHNIGEEQIELTGDVAE